MMDLYRLQTGFQSYLTSEPSAVRDMVVDTKKVCSDTRLNIYRDAYQSRLLKALGCNFPCLNNYLGDEQFQQVGLAYVAAYPSHHRSIRWFGDRFAAFLLDYYDRSFHFLAELATFEWHMTLTFDSADDGVFDPARMSEIPPESWADMRFKVHSTLRRINFFWNVVTIWEALANNQAPCDPVKNQCEEAWVLWRKDYLNRFYLLKKDEAWAMDTMISGRTFGEFCEGLCQWHDEADVGLRAASLLKGWMQSGLITAIF
ncbi:HvfC/BufC N-terminal domain-containing protein [Legionella spiritensis]|uniref:Putative DNA-binding domain-containing protein n=1 Tax=Legionella spiritensis TaxID=452 RepID=A0A0W0YW36_LEGSP|nr:DNA-binding domain-containing protein [Legionella spiritensis]KTD61084.1 hypothetical protein Lspi_2704 [Legionella spiritensis]SNV44786.1 Uncharacterized protein conserved in bacteria [Legionella spiritensis]